MEEQLREHLKAIYKKFDDQEKRNNGRFEELFKIIRDTKEASTSGSIEAHRKITDNLDGNPVHRAETATNIGDSDAIEPPLKRSTKKDCGRTAKKNVATSSDYNTNPTPSRNTRNKFGAKQRQKNVRNPVRLANTSVSDINLLRKCSRETSIETNKKLGERESHSERGSGFEMELERDTESGCLPQHAQKPRLKFVAKKSCADFEENYDDDCDLEKTLPRQFVEKRAAKKTKRSRTEKTPKRKRETFDEAGTEGRKKQKFDEYQKSNKRGKSKEDDKPRKVLVRALPHIFSLVASLMSNSQKEWVSDAGFGHLLSFSLDKIPHTIAVNSIWHFDSTNMVLNLYDDRIIRVTEDDVHDILGLPQGKREITLVENYALQKKWRLQFPEISAGHKITEKMISKVMTNSRHADIRFKQNFMVLMMNLFVRCIKNSYVSQEILGFVGNYDDASEYNWCKLVIDSLTRASRNWFANPHTQYYCGSLMFLIYFYLDRVKNPKVQVQRTRPAFIGWTNSEVKARDIFENIDNSFGKGEIEGSYEIIKCAEEGDLKSNLSNEVDRHTILDDQQFEVFEDIHDEHEDEERNQIIVIDDDNDEGDNDQINKKDLLDNNQYKTPEQGLQAIQISAKEYQNANDSKYDSYLLSAKSAIISVIRDQTGDMNNVNDNDDIINEKELISQVESDIKEFKDIQQRCRTNLAMAKALFSTNPTVNELEDDFAKLREVTTYPANSKQRVEERVSNAKDGTESTDTDIHGIQGIPHHFIATHFGEEGPSIDGPSIGPPPTISDKAPQRAINVAYLVWEDDAMSMEERRMSLKRYQVHSETTQDELS